MQHQHLASAVCARHRRRPTRWRPLRPGPDVAGGLADVRRVPRRAAHEAPWARATRRCDRNDHRCQCRCGPGYVPAVAGAPRLLCVPLRCGRGRRAHRCVAGARRVAARCARHRPRVPGSAPTTNCRRRPAPWWRRRRVRAEPGLHDHHDHHDHHARHGRHARHVHGLPRDLRDVLRREARPGLRLDVHLAPGDHRPCAGLRPL